MYLISRSNMGKVLGLSVFVACVLSLSFSVSYFLFSFLSFFAFSSLYHFLILVFLGLHIISRSLPVASVGENGLISIHTCRPWEEGLLACFGSVPFSLSVYHGNILGKSHFILSLGFYPRFALARGNLIIHISCSLLQIPVILLICGGMNVSSYAIYWCVVQIVTFYDLYSSKLHG